MGGVGRCFLERLEVRSQQRGQPTEGRAMGREWEAVSGLQGGRGPWGEGAP